MISLNGVKIKSFNFPAGEECVRFTLEQMQPREKYEFTWKYESSAEFFTLQQAVSLVRKSWQGRTTKPYISLVIPYFPFARQDRATVENETNALTLFCDTLKTLNADIVRCWDPHSMAVEQHFAPDKFHAYTQLDAIESVTAYNDMTFDAVVAPDEGALKKAAIVAKSFGAWLYTASKVRDPETGNITGYKVNLNTSQPSSAPAQNVLVTDDICDGGATFLILGQKLKTSFPVANLHLFTTHGIYSKGKEELLKIYQTVTCYNNMEKK